MGRWELETKDSKGDEGYARKETGWPTNSAILADVLRGYCECVSESGIEPSRHIPLLDGRARQAQVYPVKLVDAVLSDLRLELRARGELSVLDMQVAGPSPYEPEEDIFYLDDVRGDFLDPSLVREARKEEIDWCRKRKVWEKHLRRVKQE